MSTTSWIVDQITYEGARVTWDGDSSIADNEFKEYIITMEYKIDGVETSSTYSSVSNLATNNVYEFTGLESNTTYIASIKVDTVTFGESESSDTLSFTTNTILYDDLESIEQLEYKYVRLYIFLMSSFQDYEP